ncbi:MAG: hypothetical protein RLZZ272_1504 [Actinomycetota bacterium]
MVHDPDEWRRPWAEGDLALGGVRPSGTDAPAGAAGAAGSDRTGAWGAAMPAVGPSDVTGGGTAAGTSVRPPDVVTTVSAPPRARRGIALVLAAALLGAAIGTVGTFALLRGPDEAAPAEVGAPAMADRVAPLAPSTGAGSGDSVIPAVAAAVIPSVVRIETLGNVNADGSVGSGVIYRSDGIIITNHHVIAGASTITVRLVDGELLDAELVGSDPLNDLAVVRVERPGLPAVALRPTDEPLVIGETVVAIGSPFGLETSVTAGIVSGVNREIRLNGDDGAPNTIPSAIQTDAAINPGNSGGALVDSRGRLVGINTAILTRSGASEGVGFAVSVEQAISSADQLITQGFVRHPLLGITGLDVSREAAARAGLETTRGALIDSVAEGSAADAAGLRPGDVVTAMDGRALASMSELVAEVRRRLPGETVRLTIARDGSTLDVDVVLGERPRD